jgi:hypothetical protein
MDEDPSDVEITPDEQPQDAADMEKDADGNIVLDLSQPVEGDPTVHDANLAEHIDETTLNTIAQQLIDAVAEDKRSRAEWEQGLTTGLEYLGLKTDLRTYPFDGASGVFDPLMLEAVIRDLANSSGELLPAGGPVKTQIIGIPNADTEAQASRVKEFMNFYLTEGAPEWQEQTTQMLLWRAIAGSVFKKTYQDPILNRPVSPFITPDKFIVSYYADSEMETCTRATHILEMPYKSIRQLQLSGFYRDIELGDPDTANSGTSDTIRQAIDSIVGLSKSQGSNLNDADKQYQLFECHVDWDLDGFEHEIDEKPTGLPLPYIITIDTATMKVLAIRRNWRDGDDAFSKIQYFTHFRFIPGLGFYGIGYAHILGNQAQSATGLLRQMTDAETLSMFPGGLRVKGMRIDDNNILIGPCEFREIDTGGLPINQAVAPMPYKGASEVSFQLWTTMRENARGLGSTTELSVGDGRQDAPVGTTLALLEAANKIMSSTIKTAHRAFRREFKIFHALFGQYLPEKPYPFPVAGGAMSIMKTDFSSSINVIPVSDPNITSYAQRVTRAEAIMRFMQQDQKNLFDGYQTYRQALIEMGVDEGRINAVLPPPKQAVPSDPLSENENALQGVPLKAAEYQDHKAHIAAHQPLAQSIPAMQAHVAEHMAMQMRVNVQKQLGIELPPAGTKLPPQIENHIAMLTAKAMTALNQPQGAQPTDAEIAMKQIEVEASKVQADMAETEAKKQIAAYNAHMKFVDGEKNRQNRITVELLKGQNQRMADQRKNAAGLAAKQFGGGTARPTAPTTKTVQ